MTKVMRLCLRSAMVGLLAGSPAPTFGQTVTDARVWSGLVVQGGTGADSPWRWSFDSQFRMRDGLDTADSISGRGTLIRDLTSRLSRPLSATSRFTGFVGDKVMAHSRSMARVTRGFDQDRIFAGILGALTR